MPGANMANRDAEPSKRKVRLIPSIAAMIGLAVTILGLWPGQSGLANGRTVIS